jgi:hypothetical protein
LAPGGGPRHAWPKKAARRKTETGNTPQHPKAPEEIERECLPGLVRVLREEGVDAVRYFLWHMTGWHRDYDPCLWRNRATEEQKRVGWEMWVGMDKILCAVLREAHERQVEETTDALGDGPERFYGSYLDD